ncbi:diaminopimelate decarboxylase family protein [Nocardia sp. NPDC056064]|uniref:diaminopimelate decarboxylase family protein n=1 Tax=Nocardia sp. NPDC056064 TaxID=3345701 RepID=UPI0035DFF166
MTLLDLFPSLRSVGVPRLDSALWPVETHYDDHGRVTVAGVGLADVADQYGTPVCVVDEAEVRGRCRAYRERFPEAEIVYAGAALMTGAVVRWVAEEGLSVGVGSAGELATVLAAGVDPARILVHGTGKTREDLVTAIGAGVGRIVVGSLAEIGSLGAVVDASRAPQPVLLRVSPGIEVRPVVPSGFPLAGTSCAEAIARALTQPRLRVSGLHCHLGSQIHDPDHYGEAIRRMVAEMARVRREHGHLMTELDLGGGHAVASRGGDAEMNLYELADILDDALDAACVRHRFPRPRIVMEPGRAIVARAGVTVYRVVSVEHGDDGRVFVTVDGAASEHCGRTTRPGHDAVVANRHTCGPRMVVTVLGRGGGVVADDVRLPADLHPGEVLAVPCTGAHQHSPAQYGVTRPPIVALRDGRSRRIVRRETIADLLVRDVAY